MKRGLHVGQRVRVIHASKLDEMVGRVGTIIALNVRVEGRFAVELDIFPDGLPSYSYALAEWLEPIDRDDEAAPMVELVRVAITE